MSISVWHDQSIHSTIVRLHIQSHWTWEELLHALDTAQAIVNQMPCVGAIVDFDGAFTVPGGSPFLPENMDYAHRLLAMGTEMRLPVLIVNADATARMIYDFLRTMNRRATGHIYFVDTVSEAQAYFAEDQAPFCISAC